ncbi:MAG: metalloregulator ArsR/SmtB family transcription factor [Pseudomonadota bacterium]
MPSRTAVAQELSVIFKLIAHPDRIRLIEELYRSECDVSTLAERLSLTSSRVSQHLHELKSHRVVAERRDGRHHFYSLVMPELATWIVDAITFVEGRDAGLNPANIESAKRLWMSSDNESDPQPLESEVNNQ